MALGISVTDFSFPKVLTGKSNKLAGENIQKELGLCPKLLLLRTFPKLLRGKLSSWAQRYVALCEFETFLVCLHSQVQAS